MPGERTSITLPAGLDDQPVALGQLARSAGSSRSNAASGSSSRRVCTATARPLSSTKASAAPAVAQHPRQLALERRQARAAAAGEITRRLVEDQRSLPYWPNR